MRKRKKMISSRGRSVAEPLSLKQGTDRRRQCGGVEREGRVGGPHVAGEVGGGLPHWTLQVSRLGRADFKVLPLTYEQWELFHLVHMLEQACHIHFHWGRISLVVAFKGLNVILGLYKCNYSLTRGKKLGTAAG